MANKLSKKKFEETLYYYNNNKILLSKKVKFEGVPYTYYYSTSGEHIGTWSRRSHKYL